MKEEIEIVNGKLLTEKEKEIADKLLSEYYKKIQHIVKSPLLLKVVFKEYDKNGKKVKYSLNAEIYFSGIMLGASDWDWDLARAIHKLMTDLKNKIEKRFKVSEQK